MRYSRALACQGVVLCAVGLVAFSQPAAADIFVLQPGAEGKDTYGYQEGGASLDKNFGTSTELTASRAGGWQFESFIQFDLSTIPSGGYIQSAQLQLYNHRIGWANRGNGYVDVYRVLQGWIEGNGGTDNDPVGELTWNNRPAVDSHSYDSLLFLGIPNGGSASESLYPNEWRTWDMTALVQAWHEGTESNYGLALKASSGESIFPSFYSSDTALADLRPKLVITHVPEPAGIVLLLVAGMGALSLRLGQRRSRWRQA
ncbi:MAG: DNRLRE domain-containing protein [Patescibacteria group bacterium]|nr:DNRLRE domain-containing protein [Patescibacteria group bacterium]